MISYTFTSSACFEWDCISQGNYSSSPWLKNYLTKPSFAFNTRFERNIEKFFLPLSSPLLLLPFFLREQVPQLRSMKSNCTTHASWPFFNFIVGHMHSSKRAAYSTMGWCADAGASNTQRKSTSLTTDGAMSSASTSISRLPVILPLRLLLSRSSAHALHIYQYILCVWFCFKSLYFITTFRLRKPLSSER